MSRRSSASDLHTCRRARSKRIQRSRFLYAAVCASPIETVANDIKHHTQLDINPAPAACCRYQRPRSRLQRFFFLHSQPLVDIVVGSERHQLRFEQSPPAGRLFGISLRKPEDHLIRVQATNTFSLLDGAVQSDQVVRERAFALALWCLQFCVLRLVGVVIVMSL